MTQFQSLEIQNVIFGEDWINSPLTFKKMLLLIMTKSQKPFQIKVGFFNVSLERLNKVYLLLKNYFNIN
jgi:hypothetical protein